jgi:hypothetical protein
MLVQIFGAAGLYLARLERQHVDQQRSTSQAFNQALMEIV